MVFKVLGQVRDNPLHLMVLEHEILGALRLVVQLSSQLHVLNDGELGRPLKLVLIGH